MTAVWDELVAGAVLGTERRPYAVPDVSGDLAADHGRGQLHEPLRGVGADLLQGAAKAQKCVLEDIVGLLPAADPLVLAQHLAGQPAEALLGVGDEFLDGRAVEDEPAQWRLEFADSVD